jgi:hypothetical protein
MSSASCKQVLAMAPVPAVEKEQLQYLEWVSIGAPVKKCFHYAGAVARAPTFYCAQPYLS